MSSFFHTLVVVGAGLSLANCGGKARGEADVAPGSGGMGSAGKGGGGAGAPSGGTSTGGTVGTGGSFNTGGANSIGGSTSMGGVGGSITIDGGSPMGGLPGVLPATQWSCEHISDCHTVDIAGHLLNGAWLYTPCALDLSRPLGPEDCAAGEEFQCLVAQYGGQAMLVNCTCSMPDGGASCQCPASVGGCLDGTSERCADGVSLCGCARTCILL